jgi:hypothetical protein
MGGGVAMDQGVILGVTDCDCCPFARDDECSRCESELDAGEYGAPDWCPLRDGPVTVLLEE